MVSKWRSCPEAPGGTQLFENSIFILFERDLPYSGPLLKARHSQGWAERKPGARNPIRVSRVGGRAPGPGAITCYRPGCVHLSWELDGVSIEPVVEGPSPSDSLSRCLSEFNTCVNNTH